MSDPGVPGARWGPLALAFLLGVGVTVGVYEVVRVVRDTRHALALAAGRGEPDEAGGPPRDRSSANGARSGSNGSEPHGEPSARQARRDRAQRVAQRRKALGLADDPRKSRQARREHQKQAAARRTAAAGTEERPSAPSERADTGR